MKATMNSRNRLRAQGAHDDNHAINNGDGKPSNLKFDLAFRHYARGHLPDIDNIPRVASALKWHCGDEIGLLKWKVWFGRKNCEPDMNAWRSALASEEQVAWLFTEARKIGYTDTQADAIMAEEVSEVKVCVAEAVAAFETKIPPIITVPGGRWYEQKGQVWKKVNSKLYEPGVLAILPLNVREHLFAQRVLDTLEATRRIDPSQLKAASVFDSDGKSVLINCANGLFRFSSGEKVEKIEKTRHYFTGRLAAAYDPEAKCPRFEKFLREGQPEKQSQELLYWWAGYVLYPTLKYRLSLVNHGPTTTGKNTFWGGEGVGAVLGRELCTSLSLSDICSPPGYSVPDLQTAMLNVGAELDANELANSSKFKELVGGEPTRVREIRGQPYDMCDYTVKLVFLTNHMPRFKAGTDAELKRIKFLAWKNVPTVEDPELKPAIAAEKDGVFSQYMVPALQLLIDGRQCPEDSRDLRQYFALHNDPIKAFLDDRCEFGDEFKVSKNDLLTAYEHFVKDNDLRSALYDRDLFFKMFKEKTIGKAKPFRPCIGGNRIQSYTGLKLKDAVQHDVRSEAEHYEE
jgi:P4 family phage/plasmid primase-like protien